MQAQQIFDEVEHAREDRRRIRLDLDSARGDVQAARFAASRRALGFAVTDAPDLDAALAAEAEALARLDVVEKFLAEHDEDARRAALAAKVARERSIVDARRAALAARMAFDSAQAERLRVALLGDVDKYADAIAACDAARTEYSRAENRLAELGD